MLIEWGLRITFPFYSSSAMDTIKPRSLNELRQSKDAVYTAPTSHEERLDARRQAWGYVVLDAQGAPVVSCDNMSCVIGARPELSANDLENHFGVDPSAYVLADGGSIQRVLRRKA